VDDGSARCTREPLECKRRREAILQRGQQVAQCVPQATAYCFANMTSFGLADLNCSATVAACQTLHDHPGHGTPTSECAETR
jgi:hypothetical protein